jgi:hypothetical protein
MNDDPRNIVGEPAGWEPQSEADHYCVCPGCGALIDMRNLGMAFDHVGELPHGPGLTRS